MRQESASFCLSGRVFRTIMAAVALSIEAVCAVSQTPTATEIPAYDVVSIHLDKRGAGSTGTDVNGEDYNASNVTLKDLIEQAYDIREDLISGVPGPLDSLRFDVRAKILDPAPGVLQRLTDTQRRAMLMPILVERFHLKAHTELKTLPVYELVVLRDGPKFSRSPDQTVQNQGMSVYSTELKARNMPVSIFAKTLAHQVHRTVVDKTALTGIYDIDLKWSRDDAPDPDPNAPPAFFTAVQEELGLKLQPASGPVVALVVEHIQLPSEN